MTRYLVTDPDGVEKIIVEEQTHVNAAYAAADFHGFTWPEIHVTELCGETQIMMRGWVKHES